MRMNTEVKSTGLCLKSHNDDYVVHYKFNVSEQKYESYNQRPSQIEANKWFFAFLDCLDYNLPNILDSIYVLYTRLNES